MNVRASVARQRLVEWLNRDILREFQMADACLRHVQSLPPDQHPVVHRQIAQCAAAALSNATALANEVVALGGVPVVPSEEYAPMRRYRLAARAMLTHYRRRLRMADGLGLLRLGEVFRQIVRTKEIHLSHSAFGLAAGTAGRPLWS